jgi:hypothetical protein
MNWRRTQTDSAYERQTSSSRAASHLPKRPDNPYRQCLPLRMGLSMWAYMTSTRIEPQSRSPETEFWQLEDPSQYPLRLSAKMVRSGKGISGWM